MMVGCHISPKIHLETGKCDKTHLSQWENVCWTLSVCYFVLVHYPVSRLIFGLLWHPAILAVFYSSEAFFGFTITWNDTWMVHKSVQPMFSHSFWCVLSHFLVSRWIFGRIWQPTIMVHFDPKKWNFWTLPDLVWHLDDA